MKKLFTMAVLGASLSLSACGGASDDTTMADGGTGAGQENANVAPSGDQDPTFSGEGDMSSAAGAGATTGAIDGGRAGDDGLPNEDAARGGPEDALGSAEAGGAAGDGGPPDGQ